MRSRDSRFALRGSQLARSGCLEPRLADRGCCLEAFTAENAGDTEVFGLDVANRQTYNNFLGVHRVSPR
jgi:hypothetical protein